MNISDFIKDFEFIEGDRLAEITLDKSGRFYLNSSVRKLMPELEPYSTLVVGYSETFDALILIRTDKAPAKARIATYRIDKRYYMSARAFARQYHFLGRHTTFRYERGMSDGSAFIFRLQSPITEPVYVDYAGSSLLSD